MTSKKRAPRVDAAQNREHILAVARDALAESSTVVSMAELARLSGLSSATLYRHFASRRDLLEVLYLHEVDAICAAAEASAGDPHARLTDWLYAFFRFVMGKRHVAAELLEHVDERDPVFTSGRGRVTAAGQPLLRAAQDAGGVRDELSLDQILDMIVAIATVAATADYVEPILATALRGLEAAPRTEP